MDQWMDTCRPFNDPDSLHPTHQGGHRIPPFLTHSRYFYAPLGEDYCGWHFVDLYYQQDHPFLHCRDCARIVWGATSHICWQRCTYFWCYSTGMMQQVMGATPQWHSSLEVIVLETTQAWQDDTFRLLAPPILQSLIPQKTLCVLWQNVSKFLGHFGNHICLFSLPTISMPYFSNEAVLPLPPTPGDRCHPSSGCRHWSTTSAEVSSLTPQ